MNYAIGFGIINTDILRPNRMDKVLRGVMQAETIKYMCR